MKIFDYGFIMSHSDKNFNIPGQVAWAPLFLYLSILPFSRLRAHNLLWDPPPPL